MANVDASGLPPYERAMPCLAHLVLAPACVDHPRADRQGISRVSPDRLLGNFRTASGELTLYKRARAAAFQQWRSWLRVGFEPPFGPSKTMLTARKYRWRE